MVQRKVVETEQVKILWDFKASGCCSLKMKKMCHLIDIAVSGFERGRKDPKVPRPGQAGENEQRGSFKSPLRSKAMEHSLTQEVTGTKENVISLQHAVIK